jgi:hypothetical protein
MSVDRMQTDRLPADRDRPANSLAEGRVDRPRTHDAHLLELASLVRAMHRETLLQRRLRIGGLVFERVFGRSRLAWTAKESKAHAGFRRLAELLRGAVSKSDLHRCVATHLLCERCPFVLDAAGLTVSHCDAVAGLSQNDQEALLRRAVESGWSAAQTSKEKRRLLSEHYPKARGRPALKSRREPATILARVMVLLDQLEQDVALGASAEGPPSAPEVLHERLLQAERCCSGIRRRLQGCLQASPSVLDARCSRDSGAVPSELRKTSGAAPRDLAEMP